MLVTGDLPVNNFFSDSSCLDRSKHTTSTWRTKTACLIKPEKAVLFEITVEGFLSPSVSMGCIE